MSVEVVLDKLTANNASVLGCIASHEGRMYHNLPDLYTLVDIQDVSEKMGLIFGASDALETDHDAFDQVFLEYETHGLYGRRLDQGLLILLTQPMKRSQFKKSQVGVNLFLKPLSKAMQTEATQPVDVPAPESEPTNANEQTPGSRVYRGVRY